MGFTVPLGTAPLVIIGERCRPRSRSCPDSGFSRAGISAANMSRETIIGQL